MNNVITLAAKILRAEEGFRSRPYYCSNGYPTIGYGLKIGTKCAPLHFFTLTLTKEMANAWLLDKCSSLLDQLEQKIPAFIELNDDRKAILISMAYQLGVQGLLGFTNTLACIDADDFDDAAREMLDSKWAEHDSPQRAERHSQVMRTGSIRGVY
ncbi:glycoside hydrolase family protein [Marinibactrum halimedae]|uniref:Lysozyme n=1 Tax=Marinibactrum halimedae TaxID=1444977 RepID=A0AA37T8W3_9GAMM|nr:glycoside hydrolase family protein [Marinibactrum halimedae]MCD9458903.1 glycoside hydrolase family protein [Marinibactrum halimedae]GLS27751.1 hypothetical protein GCM10007877_34700 [Marinibactrum halimedae]